MKQRLLFLMSLFVLMTVGGAAFAAVRRRIRCCRLGRSRSSSYRPLLPNGDLESLKTALADGLNNGLTVNEEKELLVQLYAYAGFPRSLNGLNTLMTVLEERKARGITDTMGPDATQSIRTEIVTPLAMRTRRSLSATRSRGTCMNFARRSAIF